MQIHIRPMKRRFIYVIYAVFFIVCFIIFAVMSPENEENSSQNSDAILILLVTGFSSFVVYYDFRWKLPASQIIVPVLIFTIINAFAIIIIYLTKISVSVAFVVPFFMVEGALVYWLLEKRASALND